MKKISFVLFLIILMISLQSVSVNATEVPAVETPVAETPVETQVQTTDIIQEEIQTAENNSIITYTKAKVISVGEISEQIVGSVTDTIQKVTIEIIEGEYETEEFTTDYVLSYDIEGKILGHELKVGDTVLVEIIEDDAGHIVATVQDIVRSGHIIIMVVIFLFSIFLVGGKKGIKAILSLVITIMSIYFILLKGIYNGYNAILCSIGTAMAIIIFSFIIIGGFNKKILTAVIGTLGGVISAGIIATIFNYLANMSGACEDAIQLSINMQTVNFNFRDLLFSGIIIASVGACMDVGMSIASSLDEIKNKAKDISWKELFKSGMNIGKDTIGTMTNTLILAYVGGSITLVLLFMACDMKIMDILNMETIAQEIIAAVAGSMGVVYTVPITAFVYSFLNRSKTIYKTTSDNKIDGKRSLKL